MRSRIDTLSASFRGIIKGIIQNYFTQSKLCEVVLAQKVSIEWPSLVSQYAIQATVFVIADLKLEFENIQ